LTPARLVSLVASVILAALLLALLFRYGQVDLAALGRLLFAAPPLPLAAVLVLLAVNNALSGEKWRLIAASLPQDRTVGVPRLFYFAFTSIGVALGQIMPAQLSLVLSRSLGAHLHGGRALTRGASATLFDYFFDVVVVALLALATTMVLLTGSGGAVWIGVAVAICLAGFLLYSSAARLAARLAGRLGLRGQGRLWTACAAIARSPLLRPAIGRRLLLLSVARFAVLALIGIASAKAIRLDLPAWQIAAALPFAVIGSALAITPGGLGVNEWAVSSILLALGTPLPAAAQWALVNRVLVAVAAALCGLCGALIAVAARPRTHGKNER
jgi:Lysylphosphatidylglycerol synthase TM region